MNLSKKYILIIITSILLFPISYLGVNFTYYTILTNMAEETSERFQTEEELTTSVHTLTESLQGESEELIVSTLEDQTSDDNQSRFLWINDQGQTLFSQDVQPSNTTTAFQYLDQKKEKGYFVTSSYLKGSTEKGYLFVMVPQSALGTGWEVLRDRYAFLWFVALGIIWFTFVFISWFFFKQISNRLKTIQQNMESNKNRPIPHKLHVGKKDEIGNLEQSFNHMVEQLNESRLKEKNEEAIRKKLIASLSHDLRTPLSVMSGHAYNMQQHALPPDLQNSVSVILQKIAFVSELMDNLTSYTVLSEGKLPQKPQDVNIVQLVQTVLIEYYPLFEKQGFEVEVEFEESIQWHVDPTWFKRIMDNLFQNVQRHASEGKHIGVRTDQYNGQPALMIEDRGPGMQHSSHYKGTGIGLSIVDMMIKQMNLMRTVIDQNPGTLMIIHPKKD